MRRLSRRRSGPKVWVGRLPVGTTESEIICAFGEESGIVGVNIIEREDSDGFAFVEFENESWKQKALWDHWRIALRGWGVNVREPRQPGS